MSKCNSRRRQFPNPARKNVPKRNLSRPDARVCGFLQNPCGCPLLANPQCEHRCQRRRMRTGQVKLSACVFSKRFQDPEKSQIRSLRPVVRTSDFQSENVGSTPAGITKWSVGVNGNISARHADDAGSSPVRSSITEMVPSSSGQDTGLSLRKRGFDSRRHRQIGY